MDRKHLWVIGRGSNYSYVHKRISHSAIGCNVLAVSWDSGIVSFLKKNGVSARTIDDYSESYRDIYKPFDEGIGLLNGIFDKNNFPEGINSRLYAILEAVIPYLATFHVNRIISNLNIVRYIYEKETPAKIILSNFSSYDYLQNAFICYSESKGIELQILNYSANNICSWRYFYMLKPFIRMKIYIVYFSLKLLIRYFGKKIDKSEEKTKKIYFVSPSARQIAAYMPIIKNIIEKGCMSGKVLCTSERGKMDFKCGGTVKVARLSEYTNMIDLFGLSIAYLSLLKEWKHFKKINRNRGLLLYQSINVEKYFYGMIEKDIPFNFDKYLDALFKTERLFESSIPSMVIATEDPAPKVRNILLNARKRNIPTATMLFGFIRRHSLREMFPITDYYFVPGQLAKYYFMENDIQEEKIKITCDSRLKTSSEFGHIWEKQNYEKYGLDGRKKSF